MGKEKNCHYDVAIIGSGVTGAAIAYLLHEYTNVKKVAVFEKFAEPATVNSHPRNNSQTLHFGDIETNYSLEKATIVNRGAQLVKNYLESKSEHSGIYQTFPKMVLAVGSEEVQALKKRGEEFKNLFPTLEGIGRKRIGEIEPKVIEGRDESEELFALLSHDGLTVNYQRLARSFIQESPRYDVKFNHCIDHVTKEKNSYRIHAKKGSCTARVVIYATGGGSLVAAKRLNYGQDLIILPVAGSFFHTPKVLNGKVYTLQMKKLPFAAVHGDPDLCHSDKTRFGPTAKVLPMLERGNYRSVFEFLKMFDLKPSSIIALLTIILDPTYLKFVAWNVLYDLPKVGKYAFLKNVKKIIPTIKATDISLAKGIGGIRPQIVNRKKRAVAFGEAKILGDNIIFNITPSPGASTCLANAEADVKTVMDFFGGEFDFDAKRFESDLVKPERIV